MSHLETILGGFIGDLVENKEELTKLVLNALVDSVKPQEDWEGQLQDELLGLLGYDNIEIVSRLMIERNDILQEELKLDDIRYLDACTSSTDNMDSLYESMSERDRLILFVMENTNLSSEYAAYVLQICDWDPLVALDHYSLHIEGNISDDSVYDGDSDNDQGFEKQNIVPHFPHTASAATVSTDSVEQICPRYKTYVSDQRVYALTPVSTVKIIGRKESDLHHMKLVEAEEHVRRTVNGILDKINRRSDKDQCIYNYHIITGRGLHSLSAPVIKNAIVALLKQNRIRYRINNATGGGSINAVITSFTPYL